MNNINKILLKELFYLNCMKKFTIGKKQNNILKIFG